MDVVTGGEGEDTFVFEAQDVTSGRRHFGADQVTDFSGDDVIDFSGFFSGSVVANDVVRLTETATGTTVEAQIGRRGTFVEVVELEDVFGLNVDQMANDGLLLV